MVRQGKKNFLCSKNEVVGDFWNHFFIHLKMQIESKKNWALIREKYHQRRRRGMLRSHRKPKPLTHES
jgi:hypothetical protein